jgi:CelD/BcsL family acetyltransferase involved in cellulose biosynthesis
MEMKTVMAILDMRGEEKQTVESFETVGQGLNLLLGENETKADASVTIERIRDINALEAIQEDWNALFEKTEVKTVELSYLWQVTYWKQFHENAELFVLTVKRSDCIIAIVPLKLSAKRRLGITVRSLEFIAASESNYQDLIVGENSDVVLDCVFRYLLERQGAWDALALNNISEFSGTVPYLLARHGKMPLYTVINQDKCVYFQSDSSSMQKAASAGGMGFINRNLAHTMRRLARDLGEVHLLRCQTEEQLNVRLGQFFDLHRKRWNDTESPSQFNDERFCRFYADVAPQLFAAHQIELFSLQAGEKQLGLALVFLLGRTAVGQLMAYDVRYSKYSPMRVLLGLNMNELISGGFESMDYGAYQPYKEEWTNHTKTRLNFEFYPHKLLPFSLYLFARLYGTALAQVRDMPLLLRAAKYLRRNARLFFRRRANSADRKSPLG